MSYRILPYSYRQADKIGVEIKPSTVKGKKIDVYKGDKKVASVGAKGYLEYPHYLAKDRAVAEERRKNYKARHQGDRTKVGTPGWYADKLLW